MKANKDYIQDIQEKSFIAWERLKEIYGLTFENLTESNCNDLFFRTWASVNYSDENPNVLRDAQGNRLFERNQDFELYPNNANDIQMKAVYKRIYQFIARKESFSEQKGSNTK